jgi:ribosomal protein S18 acetylase RimI-like enzyme
VTVALEVRPLTEDMRPWARSYLIEHWGSDLQVAHGEAFRPHEHDGFVATLDGAPAGLLTCRRDGRGSLEVTSLTAAPPWQGVGTALLAEAVHAAREAGCERLWLITTNDNVDALRFYQRRGMQLAALRPGAIDAARLLKPEIPAVGDHGIPIHDEIELELRLEPGSLRHAPPAPR